MALREYKQMSSLCSVEWYRSTEKGIKRSDIHVADGLWEPLLNWKSTFRCVRSRAEIIIYVIAVNKGRWTCFFDGVLKKEWIVNIPGEVNWHLDSTWRWYATFRYIKVNKHSKHWFKEISKLFKMKTFEFFIFNSNL